ncbi:MAG: hypothetical protein ACRCYU_10555 [Nocardioides sp.]
MKSGKVNSRVVSKAAKEGARRGALLVVRYGPQAKIVWDRGGRQAAAAAAKRARTLHARRKAFAHAGSLINGTVLKVATTGITRYVVFSADRPVATYPPSNVPYAVLLEHTDVTNRFPVPSKVTRAARRSRRKSVVRTAATSTEVKKR